MKVYVLEWKPVTNMNGDLEVYGVYSNYGNAEKAAEDYNPWTEIAGVRQRYSDKRLWDVSVINRKTGLKMEFVITEKEVW